MKCSGTDLVHHLDRAQSALAGCVCSLLFQCFTQQFASHVYAIDMGRGGATHALPSGPQGVSWSTGCLPACMSVLSIDSSEKHPELHLRRRSEYVRKNIISPTLLRNPGEDLQILDSIANYNIM
jgi:hypothetical protein